MGELVKIEALKVYELPLSRQVVEGGRIFGPAGELAQVVNGQCMQFLAYVEFKGNINVGRGNHYHVNRDESLYIMCGSLRALYEDVRTQQRQEVLLHTGDLVNVPRNCAHVYYALEYTQAIEFSPTAYNPSDTIRYEFGFDAGA